MLVTIALMTVGFLALVVAIIAVYDLTQRKHAVMRNFPVIGRFRYLFEEMGQPLRQYFFAGDRDERPYNRVTRSWVYASAKGQNNFIGFGSQVDHNEPGRMAIVPSITRRSRTPARARPIFRTRGSSAQNGLSHISPDVSRTLPA